MFIVDPNYCEDVSAQVEQGNALLNDVMTRTLGALNSLRCELGYVWNVSLSTNVSIHCIAKLNGSFSYGAWALEYGAVPLWFPLTTLCKCMSLLLCLGTICYFFCIMCYF